MMRSLPTIFSTSRIDWSLVITHLHHPRPCNTSVMSYAASTAATTSIVHHATTNTHLLFVHCGSLITSPRLGPLDGPVLPSLTQLSSGPHTVRHSLYHSHMLGHTYGLECYGVHPILLSTTRLHASLNATPLNSQLNL